MYTLPVAECSGARMWMWVVNSLICFDLFCSGTQQINFPDYYSWAKTVHIISLKGLWAKRSKASWSLIPSAGFSLLSTPNSEPRLRDYVSVVNAGLQTETSSSEVIRETSCFIITSDESDASSQNAFVILSQSSTAELGRTRRCENFKWGQKTCV